MSQLNKRNTALTNVHKVFNPLTDSPPDKKSILFFSPNHSSTKYKLGGCSGTLKPFKPKVTLPPIHNHNINVFKSSTKLTSFSNKNLNEIGLFHNHNNSNNNKLCYSISNTKENITKKGHKGSVNMKLSSNALHNITENINGELSNRNNNNGNAVTVSNVSNNNSLMKRRQKNLTFFNHVPSNSTTHSPSHVITRRSMKTLHSLNNSPIKEVTERKTTLSYVSKPVKTKMSFNENILRTHKKLSNLSLTLFKEHKTNYNNNNKEDLNSIKATKGSSSSFSHSEISQNGKDFEGKVKTNQDTYIMLLSILDINDVLIYGVMDGHGVNGHFASKYVKDYIIEHFTNRTAYTSTQKQIDTNLIYKKLTKNNYALLTNFSNNVHDDILNKAKFDCHFSGTTMNLIFHIGTKLICCNVGDSRSIIITYHPDNDNDIQYKVESFSVDHKPENTEEYNRIISKGGEVYPFEDEIALEGSKRVWVKNEKFPGIAVSRTIGDLVAHTVGVIATPEYKEKDIINDNVCIVISASDGVWEFLTNEDVKDIVMPFYMVNDVNGAANEIVRKASLKWKEEGLKMDDITCVVVFLNKQKKHSI